MRRSLIVRSATVVTGLAAALSLSACSFEFSVGGPDRNDDTTTETRAEPDGGSDATEAPASDAGTDSGSSASSGAGTSSGSGEGSGTGSDPSGPVEIDGYDLAQDVKQAAERESGVTGIYVECRDLLAYDVGSSTTCDMEMPDGEKHFPVAKVTSINGNYVEYTLEFPGIDF